jgi:3-phosphoshikimate 1-carboxyvinyltransferase
MKKAIQPVAQVQGEFRLPGSKSVTHRALLMAALAAGESRVVHPLRAEDTLLTAAALEQLGVGITWEEDAVRVAAPQVRWRQPQGPIHLGNSGTSMRLLAALLAAGHGRFILDGTPRLRERPLGPVLQALSLQGVSYRCLGQEGYPPVEISSQGLQGGELWIDASKSSQFLSALLIAAPHAARDVTIGWKEPVASLPYVHLTLSMMQQFGADWRWVAPNQVLIPAPQCYQARTYLVEGDCSSASYWWAAAALTGGQVFTAPTSREALQGDCRFLEILQRMGCGVHWERDGVRVVGPPSLQAVDVDLNAMPDVVPTLAILAAFAQGETRIGNVEHLRIKESDRLQVVALELRKLGVTVQERADALIIRGGLLHGAAIDAHDDHRIAMAFALVGLRVPGVEIHGAEAVAKSFPTFWEELRRLSPATT